MVLDQIIIIRSNSFLRLLSYRNLTPSSLLNMSFVVLTLPCRSWYLPATSYWQSLWMFCPLHGTESAGPWKWGTELYFSAVAILWSVIGPAFPALHTVRLYCEWSVFKQCLAATLTNSYELLARCWLMTQGDHLSGKQGNVRDFSENHRKNFARENCPKVS